MIWPRKLNCGSIRPYFRCKFDLHVESGCLLRGPKVAIPQSLIHRMLDELHNSHAAIVKMKLNARSRMWCGQASMQISSDTLVSARRAPARASRAVAASSAPVATDAY